MIHAPSAEQLMAQFADRHPTFTGAYELALVEHVLVQLADPRSDYGDLLADLCQRRWTVGQLREPRRAMMMNGGGCVVIREVAVSCEVDVFEGFDECDRTGSIHRGDVALCGEHAKEIAAWGANGRANERRRTGRWMRKDGATS